jgi:hypothetical protein
MCFGLVLSVGCGSEVADTVVVEDVTRAGGITTAEQALSTVPPIHDPQLCVLPSGRYVVSATVTNTENVYNVTFHNDGVEGSQPSANCKTMKLVWDQGIPYPAIPPQRPMEVDFPKRLLEGWWHNELTPKRFAVKAVWATEDNLGVITQIAGNPARGYFVASDDFGISDALRFNWTGVGSDANHTKYFFYFPLYSDRELLITDPSSSAAYQRLSCQSGTTRLMPGPVDGMNCPL